MMKNIANYISISRILMSIALILTETFSFPFYIIYIYCGMSDMIDGYVARKSKNTSRIGAVLDSVADIIFVIISMIKILPILDLSSVIIIWIFIIFLIKICNVICAYISFKKIVLPHTIANKITGFILFITPLILLINSNLTILEIIICCIATFSAIQEGYYIKTRNY